MSRKLALRKTPWQADAAAPNQSPLGQSLRGREAVLLTDTNPAIALVIVDDPALDDWDLQADDIPQWPPAGQRVTIIADVRANQCRRGTYAWPNPSAVQAELIVENLRVGEYHVGAWEERSEPRP